MENWNYSVNIILCIRNYFDQKAPPQFYWLTWPLCWCSLSPREPPRMRQPLGKHREDAQLLDLMWVPVCGPLQKYEKMRQAQGPASLATAVAVWAVTMHLGSRHTCLVPCIFYSEVGPERLWRRPDTCLSQATGHSSHWNCLNQIPGALDKS